MKLICNMKNICEEAKYCGGAIPHEHCNECSNCPFNKEAKCIKYKGE